MIFARKQPSKKTTVFVGLSGGVDSSVATKRLIDQGYRVVGAFMKTWYPDWLPCDWKSERRDAMRVCAKLGIPFVEYDLGQQYFNEVGMYLVDEYKSGRTPNPDVMCNKHVKFDAFWQAAIADGADYIATGHYARKGSADEILAGIDNNKDQTYFLWGINLDVVPNILFPIGDTKKERIRAEATRSGLITARKPDSQGICFLGQVDLQEFLSHYLDLQPGVVCGTDGKQVGVHESAYIYTIGQRHGFTLHNQETNSEAMFVLSKDVTNNTLVVGTKSELESITKKNKVALGQTNWFTQPEIGGSYQARFRYRQPLFDITVTSVNLNLSQTEVGFTKPQSGIAPGQSLVMYDGAKMIGGGIIVQ